MHASTPLPSTIRFGPFLANLRAGELYKDGTKLRLQEQPFKILAMLLERAGDLVTREELREMLWPDNTYVDFDHGINMAVSKIREALDDSSEESQFVETLGRRGYRFMAPVERVADEERSTLPVAVRLAPIFFPAPRRSVGREKELAELGTAFELAVGGRGTLVCLAGEPGIGKTTLVQDFLSSLQASGKGFELAIGRCSQRLAGEEAYLPFLEALDNLLRGNPQVTRTLRDTAPSWYTQLFPLSENNVSDRAWHAQARATTQEKVKRELAAFVCEMTRNNPLVLFFDDLHWTDPSTIDLLAYLATKFYGTRILVVATYRPTEMLLLKHPFIEVKRDLQGRALCREFEVEFLSLADVERYIGLEFLGNTFPHEFAKVIHSRTEGNPLFMVDLLRYLRDRKVIVKDNEDTSWHLAQSLPDLSRNVPQSVNGVIERKIDQLSEREREVLTAAAVAGYEFDSTALAQALKAEGLEIEELLDCLERVYAIAKRIGEEELPGNLPTVRYRFVHVLYQNALFTSLTPSRRITLAAALAHSLEALYGDRLSSIAYQLAFLYETARDPWRASEYFLIAAQNAQRIFANKEAITLAKRGLELLNKTPESSERSGKELALHVTLGFSFLSTAGYASPETGAHMTKARELCQRLGDNTQLFPALFGIWVYYLCRGNMGSAREIAEHLLSVSCGVSDSAVLLIAHATMAFTMQHQGELIASRQEFEETLRHYDPAERWRYMEMYKLEPGIQVAGEMVRTLWLLGFPDQARRQVEDNLARAREFSIPVTLAFMQRSAASLYQHLRLPEMAREVGEACITLCEAHGIMLERAWNLCPYGWAIAEQGKVEEGISQIRAGLELQLSVGAEVARSQFHAILAETLWHAGRVEEALRAVEDGLTASKRNGEPYYDAELWRLKGELSAMGNQTAQAEACFQTAMAISRQQLAKSLELRAATSLARIWQKQGKQNLAKQILGEIYLWFTEGFTTPDLIEAGSLFDALS